MISEILKHIGKLNYTLLSNLIGIIVIAVSAPLITLYYTSEQMGEYAIFVSIVALLSYISTAALDQVILAIPAGEERKMPYFLGAFFIVNIPFIIFLYLLIFFITSIIEIPPYSYLIPLTVVFSSFLTLIQSYFVKLKEMKLFFFSTISSQSIRVFSFIYFGLTQNIHGLLLSEIFSRLIPIGLYIFPLLNRLLKNQGMGTFSDTFNNGFSLLRENKEVIRKFVPSQLIESAQASLPLYFISAIFGLESAGIYGLAQRLITVPIFLVSRGLSDVLLREATELFTTKIQDFAPYIRNMHLFLLALSSILFFLIFLVSKPILEIFLPTNWLGIIPILPPMSLIIINRISMNPFFAMTIPLKKNIYKLLYEITGTILITAIGTICYFDHLSFYSCVLMISVTTLFLSSLFFYIIFGSYLFKLSNKANPI